MCGIDKFFLHLIDKENALFDGVHDGIAVHFELILIEIIDDLI